MKTRCAVRDSNGWEIAEIPGLLPALEHPSADANARLIAAAPALYDALEKLLGERNNIECLGEDSALEINHGLQKKTRARIDQVVTEARAALKLARGEK